MRVMRRLLLGFVLAGPSCDVDVGETLPEGKLAMVGEVVLGPEDLAGVQSQLGSYAQLRFRGAEGSFALLEALVVTEMLAQEAIANGLGDDPRVRFAVLEEIATARLAAELERRVPYASVAADEVALREHYETHPEQFTRPERRSAQGVLMTHLQPAGVALDQLKRGEVELPDLGDVVSTTLQERDDVEFPWFHPVLFDVGEVGHWLAEPVVIGERVFVGRVETIQPAQLEPFDDPAVQERLVHAVRAPRLELAKRALLEELRTRP